MSILKSYIGGTTSGSQLQTSALFETTFHKSGVLINVYLNHGAPDKKGTPDKIDLPNFNLSETANINSNNCNLGGIFQLDPSLKIVTFSGSLIWEGKINVAVNNIVIAADF